MGFNFKTKSSKAVKGGSGKMVGKQHAGKQVPGKMIGGGASGGKFPMGGKGHMVGKQSVKPSKAC